MKKLIVLLVAVVFGGQMYGQTYNTFEPSKTQFMLRGYGHTGFEYMDPPFWELPLPRYSYTNIRTG